WYDTPNIHFCTIKDFEALCGEVNAKVEQAVAINSKGERMGPRAPRRLRNLFGQQAVFLLSH
ncbi:MAG: methionine biosynthesis protein MetW, partial [Bauldia sp.]|nr:methionine biosynthesis protein MetW [Bauldia sp.]